MRNVFAAASLLCLAGCATAPVAEPVAVPVAVPDPAAKPPEVPGGMQWLYGAAEGAAASVQTYRAFEAFVRAALRERPTMGVVLAEGSSLAAPAFVPCGNKPPAVILDADETAVQNQGLEHALAARGVASDREVLNRWQAQPRLTGQPAMPGAAETLARLRSAGVTVIFNTNRDSANAAATVASLNAAGVGPAEHLRTLFLRGDVDGKGGKDGRRSHVAKNYCVVAMAGDQMGDFTDLLNAPNLAPLERRRLATSGAVGALWGNGWFLLSNPVYGPGLKGTIDEVFSPDNRWDGER
ncbi:HAD family acid phosphatase [Sphingomonas mesophila]|uniref:HAD family acid phosphatase n=1 Tax=Sphingomonas mesophila TaxID=2303576 RepID=UPI000E590407|nr:HAD family acid phosphatase [Sphingomonas mesophila]